MNSCALAAVHAATISSSVAVGPGHSEILGDGSREQFHLLGNRGHARTQSLDVLLSNIHTVDNDLSRDDVVEAWDELHQGCLPGAGRANERDEFALANLEIDPAENLSIPLGIGEVNRIEAHRSERCRIVGCVSLGDLWGLV